MRDFLSWLFIGLGILVIGSIGYGFYDMPWWLGLAGFFIWYFTLASFIDWRHERKESK